MPSNSFRLFQDYLVKTEVFFASARRSSPSSKGFQNKQSLLAAALTSYVSAWQTYITSLIDEFFSELSNPSDPTYHSIHTLLKESFYASRKKFNTPNWENTRELFLLFTGSDPTPSWLWKRRGFNIQQTRDRLNEILKVRHSFAHGLALPAFTWTTSVSGRPSLSNESILDTKTFIGHIVKNTDVFYKNKLKVDFGKSLLTW